MEIYMSNISSWESFVGNLGSALRLGKLYGLEFNTAFVSTASMQDIVDAYGKHATEYGSWPHCESDNFIVMGIEFIKIDKGLADKWLIISNCQY
jgi:hypothetical protein